MTTPKKEAAKLTFQKLERAGITYKARIQETRPPLAQNVNDLRALLLDFEGILDEERKVPRSKNGIRDAYRVWLKLFKDYARIYLPLATACTSHILRKQIRDSCGLIQSHTNDITRISTQPLGLCSGLKGSQLVRVYMSRNGQI